MDDKTFMRISEYVQHEDVFVPTQTLIQALEYHSNLRLGPHVSDIEKRRRIDRLVQVSAYDPISYFSPTSPTITHPPKPPKCNMHHQKQIGSWAPREAAFTNWWYPGRRDHCQRAVQWRKTPCLGRLCGHCEPIHTLFGRAYLRSRFLCGTESHGDDEEVLW